MAAYGWESKESETVLYGDIITIESRGPRVPFNRKEIPINAICKSFLKTRPDIVINHNKDACVPNENAMLQGIFKYAEVKNVNYNLKAAELAKEDLIKFLIKAGLHKCEPITIEEALLSLHDDSAPGLYWTRKYKTLRQDELLANDEARTEIIQRAKDIIANNVQSPTGAAIKEEALKESKLKENRLRLYNPDDIATKVAHKSICYQQDNWFSINDYNGGTAIGAPTNKGYTHLLFRNYLKVEDVDDIIEVDDVTGNDSTLPSEILEDVYEVKCYFSTVPDKMWMVGQQVIYCVVSTPLGFSYITMRGMKSGKNTTITDNSLGTMFIARYLWYSRTEELFSDHNNMICLGDDGIKTRSNYGHHIQTPDILKYDMNTLGMKFKHIHKGTLFDVDFMGHFFKIVDGIVVPYQYVCDKWDSLVYNTKPGSGRILCKINSLISEAAHADDIDQLVDFRDFLLNEHRNSTDFTYDEFWDQGLDSYHSLEFNKNSYFPVLEMRSF